MAVPLLGENWDQSLKSRYEQTSVREAMILRGSSSERCNSVQNRAQNAFAHCADTRYSALPR